MITLTLIIIYIVSIFTCRKQIIEITEPYSTFNMFDVFMCFIPFTNTCVTVALFLINTNIHIDFTKFANWFFNVKK